MSRSSPSSSTNLRPRSLREFRGLLNNGLAHLRARWALRTATSLGPRVRLWGRVHLSLEGQLTIGGRTRLAGTLTPIELMVGSGAELQIGSQVYINYGTSIGAFERITIKDHCNLGSYVMIIDNNLHELDPARRLERPPSAPVVLEENVWLGSRVVVLPGVTIGADSVVGVGSIVTEDIPPRSLAVGVPAKMIRRL
ncbi:MAG: acyltransferase [Oscillochloridaceae bacterium umkhey_bin13]